MNIMIRVASCPRRSVMRLVLRMAAVAAGLGLSSLAGAGFLVVPNGDFSVPANAGSVGGGLVGASGTNVPIGAGPWTGSYDGVIGVLVPPTLSISALEQRARIEGLLGVNVLGIVNSGGHFSQALSHNLASNRRYTLIAHLRTDALLDLPLLATAGTGISLHAGGNLLSSSTTAPLTHVRADLVEDTTLRIQLSHDTASVTPAPLSLQLFDRPQGLLTAALIDSAEFSAVRVAESALPGGNSSLIVSGGGSQSTPVGDPFPQIMTAVVRDQNGNPIPDVLVTLTAPAEGASATLFAGAENGRVITTFTDANGVVTLSAAANPIAGCYSVTGEVAGISTRAVFHLRNYSQQQIADYKRSHPGVKGLPQDSVFCNGFE